jgi:deazaflavin-dependent oxidoreductase (nitroreductase family)
VSGAPHRPGDLEDDLVARGWTIRLETRGRRSGRPRRAVIGFVEGADGSLLVAASSEASHWASNLRSDPRCRVEREGRVAPYRACALGTAGQRSAVAALILKYGTPAERLGGGPAFRLDPDPDPDPGTPSSGRADGAPGESGA